MFYICFWLRLPALCWMGSTGSLRHGCREEKGPPFFQPFYDLSKLFSKQMIAVNGVQLLLILSYLVFLAVAGSMLFAGADILMCLFLLSTADMFLVMAASSDSSPFATMAQAVKCSK